MKPVPFICILRASKSQLQENGFKDNVIDSIYKLILENAAKDSHKIYFPDLYVPGIIQVSWLKVCQLIFSYIYFSINYTSYFYFQLKAFLKKCHIANYNRKMKQLLEKIEENRKYIETERTKTVVDLKNMSEIKNWENRIKVQGTSVVKFYESWIKIYQSQKLKILTKNEAIAEYTLPTIRKPKKGKPIEESEHESEEESDFELRLKSGDSGEQKSEPPAKPKKKKLKKAGKKVEDIELPRDNTDIVQDMNTDDWD